MISDSDYQELREVMFKFKNQYPDMGDFLLVYNSLKDTPILKKLNDTVTVGEIGDALYKIDNEYRAIELAALDLSEALSTLLVASEILDGQSYPPDRKDVDYFLAACRQSRNALATAGIIIEKVKL